MLYLPTPATRLLIISLIIVVAVVVRFALVFFLFVDLIIPGQPRGKVDVVIILILILVLTVVSIFLGIVVATLIIAASLRRGAWCCKRSLQGGGELGDKVDRRGLFWPLIMPCPDG